MYSSQRSHLAGLKVFLKRCGTAWPIERGVHGDLGSGSSATADDDEAADWQLDTAEEDESNGLGGGRGRAAAGEDTLVKPWLSKRRLRST